MIITLLSIVIINHACKPLFIMINWWLMVVCFTPTAWSEAKWPCQQFCRRPPWYAPWMATKNLWWMVVACWFDGSSMVVEWWKILGEQQLGFTFDLGFRLIDPQPCQRDAFFTLPFLSRPSVCLCKAEISKIASLPASAKRIGNPWFVSKDWHKTIATVPMSLPCVIHQATQSALGHHPDQLTTVARTSDVRPWPGIACKWFISSDKPYAKR